jgi:UDP-N-acetylglucosamine 1-carboxyvinyltransferase
MAAAVLARSPVELRGVPRIADVATQARLLGRLGVRVVRLPPIAGNDRLSDVLRIETVCDRPSTVPHRLARRIRASFCLLGPLLARRGRAVVSLPGGCSIGDRPVDLHLAGLAALGADLTLRGGRVIATADRLRGAEIDLRGAHGPTVTGTANVLCAATCARGITIVRGAAVEPEIVDLCRLLRKMGAQIDGLATTTIRVRGVEELGGATHTVIADRIETGTMLIAAAVTGGDVTVTGVCPKHLASTLEMLESAGCSLHAEGNHIRLTADRPPRAMHICATPYPGVPTDLQPQFCALAAVAEGRSIVTDRVFPARVHHLGELRRLGADIRHVDRTTYISGRRRLDGAPVTAADLRGGVALVLAALAARGRSVVRGAGHIARGHDDLAAKLASLGAAIRRSPADAEIRVPAKSP